VYYYISNYAFYQSVGQMDATLDDALMLPVQYKLYLKLVLEYLCA